MVIRRIGGRNLNSTNDYVKEVLKTKSNTLVKLDQKASDMLHSAMGVSTEAGELLDVIKKNIYYNKPIDIPNLKEELGDLLWYIGLMIQCLDSTFLEIMDMNVKKLSKRYKDQKYTDAQAIHRDVKNELSHIDEPPVVSNCPKCDVYPEVTHGNLENDTGYYSVYLTCPNCGFSAPHGKDHLKRKALEKGIEIWEREVIKSKSFSF